jgi:hypothetical protein
MENALHKILRMAEAKNFTPGQSNTLRKTIVACQVKFSGASFSGPYWRFIFDASAKSLGTRYFAWEEEEQSIGKIIA